MQNLNLKFKLDYQGKILIRLPKFQKRFSYFEEPRREAYSRFPLLDSVLDLFCQHC